MEIHFKGCKNINCPIPHCSSVSNKDARRYDSVQLRVDLNVKSQEIALLKESLKHSKHKVETIDLTNGEGTVQSNKRPRTDDTPKSSLAALHEQNQKHSQRLVQIKQEKNDAETALEGVRGEKEAVEANLKEAREDLEDEKEVVEQQLLATDCWQGRFGELADMVESCRVDDDAIAAIKDRFGKDPQGSFMEVISLLESCQVDGAAIAAIKNRSLVSGS